MHFTVAEGIEKSGIVEKSLRIDRPFVYTLLRVTRHTHKQDHPVFIGHVQDPKFL